MLVCKKSVLVNAPKDPKTYEAKGMKDHPGRWFQNMYVPDFLQSTALEKEDFFSLVELVVV